MRKLMTLALLIGGWGAANGTSLPSLITGSGGQMRLSKGIFLVSKRTADLNYLTLGIGSSQSKSGRVDGVTVYAAKEFLTPSELALFSKSVRQVALVCFNLNPARMNALTNWIGMQNESSMRDAQFNFGPMTANFRRSITNDGVYQTYVTMFREGQPGTGAWKNYCTP